MDGVAVLIGIQSSMVELELYIYYKIFVAIHAKYSLDVSNISTNVVVTTLNVKYGHYDSCA